MVAILGDFGLTEDGLDVGACFESVVIDMVSTEWLLPHEAGPKESMMEEWFMGTGMGDQDG